MTSLGLGLGCAASSWSSPGVWLSSLGLVAGSVGLRGGSLRLVASLSWFSPGLGAGVSGMSSSSSEVEPSLDGSPAGP